jgi:hypothetical protein
VQHTSSGQGGGLVVLEVRADPALLIHCSLAHVLSATAIFYGFGGLLRSRHYSASGSAGSGGSGISRSSSGGCSVRPGCPLLRSSWSTRAIRSCSCSAEASRSCWSVSNGSFSGSKVLPSLRFFASVYSSPCGSGGASLGIHRGHVSSRWSGVQAT